MAGICNKLFLLLHILYFRAHDALGKQRYYDEGQTHSEAQNAQRREQNAAHQTQLLRAVQIDYDRAALLSVSTVIIISPVLSEFTEFIQRGQCISFRLFIVNIGNMACLDLRDTLVLIKKNGKIPDRIVILRCLAEEVSDAKDAPEAPVQGVRKRTVVVLRHI